jgi:hypothetical protein
MGDGGGRRAHWVRCAELHRKGRRRAARALQLWGALEPPGSPRGRRASGPPLVTLGLAATPASGCSTPGRGAAPSADIAQRLPSAPSNPPLHLEHAAGLLIDEPADALHAAAAGRGRRGWEGEREQGWRQRPGGAREEGREGQEEGRERCRSHAAVAARHADCRRVWPKSTTQRRPHGAVWPGGARPGGVRGAPRREGARGHLTGARGGGWRAW